MRNRWPVEYLTSRSNEDSDIRSVGEMLRRAGRLLLWLRFFSVRGSMETDTSSPVLGQFVQQTMKRVIAGIRAHSFTFPTFMFYLLAALPSFGSPQLPGINTAISPEIVLNNGHLGAVSSLAFSPNGRWLASGSGDKTVKIWDPITGRVLRTLRGHGGGVTAVAFTPNGLTLISASQDKTIKLWDPKTGTPPITLTEHSGIVWALAISPDGHWLATGDDGFPCADIKIWDLKGRVEKGSLKDICIKQEKSENQVMSLAFGSDSLFAGTTQGTIYRIDISSWEIVESWHANDNWVVSLAFIQKKNHPWVASSSANGAVCLWDMDADLSDRQKNPLRLQDPNQGWSAGRKLALKPDGSQLALGSDLQTNRWTVDGKPLSPIGVISSEVGPVAFHPTKDVLAMAGTNNISIWDLKSGERESILKDDLLPLRGIVFSEDKARLLSFDDDRTVHIWDLKSGRPLATPDALIQPPEEMANYGSGGRVQVQTAAFSSDGNRVAFGSAFDFNGFKNTTTIYDVRKGNAFRIPKAGDNSTKKGLISGVAFSRDGELLAAGGAFGTVQIWRTRDWELKQELDFPRECQITSISFSSQTDRLAVACFGTVRLWSVLCVGAGEWEFKEEQTYGGLYDMIAFSPDGRFLAMAAQFISILNLQTGEMRQIQSDPIPEMTGTLAFNSDGHWLISGDSQNHVKVWDVSSGKERIDWRKEGHESDITALAFNPQNATRFCSTSEDGSLRIWDLTSTAPVGTVLSMGGSEDWLVIAPDGHFDGSSGAWKKVLWRFNAQTDDVSPVEIGFRRYYTPGLLSLLLSGNEPPRVESIAAIDRSQANIEILDVQNQANEGSVTVTVGIDHRQGTVYDLHVFRNGRVVKRYPGGDYDSNTALPSESQREWSPGAAIEPQQLRISDISVPTGAQSIVFTAYAYNRAGVKTTDSPPFTFRSSKENANKQARAYIVSMGVNATQVDFWDLRFAVNSATQVGTAISERLQRNYKIVPIYLLSARTPEGRQLLSTNATKTNLKAVFSKLSGRSLNPELETSLKKAIPNYADIQKIGPDDVLFVYIASHGYKSPQGEYYAIPYDVGDDNTGLSESTLDDCFANKVISSTCKKAKQFLFNSISSVDLFNWWTEIDGDEMVLVLDSCHAGSAPGESFRDAPLGDKSFGQLAYDKGMRILTATEPDDKAFSPAQLGISFLADVLIEVAKLQPEFSIGTWLRRTERSAPEKYESLNQRLGNAGIREIPHLLDFNPSEPAATTKCKSGVLSIAGSQAVWKLTVDEQQIVGNWGDGAGRAVFDRVGKVWVGGVRTPQFTQSGIILYESNHCTELNSNSPGSLSLRPDKPDRED